MWNPYYGIKASDLWTLHLIILSRPFETGFDWSGWDHVAREPVSLNVFLLCSSLAALAMKDGDFFRDLFIYLDSASNTWCFFSLANLAYVVFKIKLQAFILFGSFFVFSLKFIKIRRYQIPILHWKSFSFFVMVFLLPLITIIDILLYFIFHLKFNKIL